jgi:hypothetical protein
MTPAKKGKGKRTLTAEEVQASNDKTSEARKRAKTELHQDNLRNRLFKVFGDAIRLKNGELPSQVKLLASLLLRTFGVLKWGGGAKRAERISTIPVGLKSVIRDSPIEGITAEFMMNKFKAVSDHASKVRVNASLLANYIFIKALNKEDRLPEADSAFFKTCLSCCRGATTSNTVVKGIFQEFSAVTGITAIPTMSGTTRVFENQADDMAVAAKNFIDIHFESRLETVLRWGLKVKLRGSVNFTNTVFNRRVGELCTFLLSDRQEIDIMGAVKGELMRLGFPERSFDDVEQLCAMVLDRDGDERHVKLKLLLDLQELFLTEDRLRYDTVCSSAHDIFPELHPVDTNKDKRLAMIKKEWGFYENPPRTMSPLPICHNAATFVRLCRKSICELFPKLKVCIEDGDPWWYKAVMDPFSKEADIPRLRSLHNKYARSEHGMFALLKMVRDGKDMPAPWMIGPSFETDGKQIRLNVITSALGHPGVPGLMNLHEAGYRVSFEDITLEEVLARGVGVYNLKHIHSENGLRGFDGVTTIPVDPGQKDIVTGAHIPGEEVRISNAAELVFGTRYPRVTFSGEDWQTKTFTRKSSTAEVIRRAMTPYGDAMRRLQGQRKNTCDINSFAQYCITWRSVCDAVWKELLTDERRGHRFLRFRAIQRTLEEVGEVIAPIRGGREKYGKRIVLFEDGMWKSKKGCASAPIKKLVRVTCQRAAVAMIPCAFSTMTCLGCGFENREGVNYRTRLCTTSHGCLLHPDTPTIEYNRDRGAKGVIAVRGVNVIAGIWEANRDWRPRGYDDVVVVA